jgi:WD40 repeat protein
MKSDKKPKKPKQSSSAAAILASILLVGGSTAFSVLVALDVIVVDVGPAKGSPKPGPAPGPGPRPGPGPGPTPGPLGQLEEEKDQLPESPPNLVALEQAAAVRQQNLKGYQEQEKSLLEQLRQQGGARQGPSLIDLKGHQQGISRFTFAFSASHRLLVATDGPLIKVWDLRTGQLKHTLTGHTQEVRILASSPDGQWLASYSADRSVRVWDLNTGANTKTLTGGWDNIGGLVFPHESQTLIAAGTFNVTGGALWFWDFQTGTQKWEIRTREEITHLAISPNGGTLATSDRSGRVTLREGSTGRRKRQLATDEVTPQVGLRALAFTPDSLRLAVGTGTRAGNTPGTLKLYHVGNGALAQTFEGPYKAGGTLAFSPDEKWLVTLGTGDQPISPDLLVWNAGTGKVHRTIMKSVGGSGDTAFSRGGLILAMANQRDTVALWDFEAMLDPKPAPPR